jgi:hypothetical protein
MKSDAALLHAFESCALPPGELTHREHVRVAWMYLRTEPFEAAGYHFCTNLRRYADAHGKTGLFHATITWAYLALVNERIQAGGEPDFASFEAANPDLFDNKGGALSRLYDAETLKSDRARRAFLLPRRS